MKNLCLTLIMALGILIFVMLGTYFVRLFDMLSRGVSMWIFLKIIFLMLPDVLRYALPFSVMIATVLVFSRMSADNEIVTLKSCGISLWQIVAPGMMLSAILSLGCLYLVLYLAPRSTNASLRMRDEALNAGNIAAIIEPGEITRLSDKLSIRVGKVDGDLMYDVHCYILNNEDGSHSSMPLDDIVAESGMFITDPDTGVRKLVLNQFSGTQLPNMNDDKNNSDQLLNPFLSASTMEIPFGFGENSGQHTVELIRKTKSMDVNMLLGNLMLFSGEDPRRTCSHWVDLQSRLALAMAPFALFVLSVPFGIRSRRNETSSGLLICVALGIVFYVFMMLGKAFSKQPELFPQYIVWIPDVAYLIFGLFAIRKIARR